MEPRTQIVTQLVAAFMSSEYAMNEMREWDGDDTKPDYIMAVEYADMIADKIIDQTIPEIVFTDK